MTIHWTENTRPDRPGIWKCKNGNIIEVHADPPINWPLGTWAFICDLPDIKDAPKYREPTMADHKRIIEVRQRLDLPWVVGLRLVGIDDGGFLTPEGSSYKWWKYARILDDGTEPITQSQYQAPTQADVGKQCEFSDDEVTWTEGELLGVFPRKYAPTHPFNGGTKDGRTSHTDTHDSSAVQAAEWSSRTAGRG